jgi:hypothetical protein
MKKLLQSSFWKTTSSSTHLVGVMLLAAQVFSIAEPNTTIDEVK